MEPIKWNSLSRIQTLRCSRTFVSFPGKMSLITTDAQIKTKTVKNYHAKIKLTSFVNEYRSDQETTDVCLCRIRFSNITSWYMCSHASLLKPDLIELHCFFLKLKLLRLQEDGSRLVIQTTVLLLKK